MTNTVIIPKKIIINKTIIGIDASLSSTGIAVMKDNDIIHVSKINTKKQDGDDNRLYIIAKAILKIVQQYNVTEACMEAQSVQRNAKTALQLSRLRGAITYVLCDNYVKITHMQPSQVRKYFMNNGSATKEDVALYVQNLFQNNKLVNDLGPLIDRSCKSKNSDEYDAISMCEALKNYYIVQELKKQE